MTTEVSEPISRVQPSPLTDLPHSDGKRSWIHPPEAINETLFDPTPTIVLADDNENVRIMIEMVLMSRGCTVLCAADGDQAWKLLCESPFALLITDHEMPGIMGLELVRKMREHALGQPAILISGAMPWDHPEFCHLLSPGAALEKPFEISQLIATICGLIALQACAAQSIAQAATA